MKNILHVLKSRTVIRPSLFSEQRNSFQRIAWLQSELPLLLLWVGGFSLRWWLVLHTHASIDGDESLVGIQALHILRGERPVYFYGQPYMGSLEAYLMAMVFLFTGVTVWGVRLESTLVSTLLILLTWAVAGNLGTLAKLSDDMYRTFRVIATACASIVPLYDAVQELHTLGGYVETYVLMLLLLYLATSLVLMKEHNPDTISSRKMGILFTVIGFTIGLGLWSDPLILPVALAVFLWLGWAYIQILLIAIRYRLRFIFTPKSSAYSREREMQWLFVSFRTCWLALPALLIGMLPALLWGYSNGWRNVSYILGASGVSLAQKLQLIPQLGNLYITCVAPRILSGALPIESFHSTLLHTALLTSSIIGITLACIPFLWVVLPAHGYMAQVRKIAVLPVLCAGMSGLAFITSSVATGGLISPCSADWVGRYASPLLLFMPFIYGAAVLECMVISNCFRRDQLRHLPLFAKAEMNSAPTNGITQCTVGIFRMIRICFFILLSFLSVAQCVTYAISDSATPFQSPFCAIAPAEYQPIIHYMEQQKIHYAWAGNLLAYPIVFHTEEHIIVADPGALASPQKALNRMPTYITQVEHAHAPAFLFFVPANDIHPELLRFFHAMGVPYTATRFPAEQGVDVLLIQPSRPVSPVPLAEQGKFVCVPQQ